MNLFPSASSIRSSALVSLTALVFVQPVLGLTGAQVNEVAEKVTVFIRGVNYADNFGSGVVIKRQRDMYTVLTAAHVVELSDTYTVTTADDLQHKVLNRRKLPDIDMAVITFRSSESYKVAKMGDSARLTPTARVFVSGFPKPGYNIPVPTYTITDGNITTIIHRSMRDGYGLAYTNPTRVGMSGGPVLNEEGLVIGIHGRKEGEIDGSQTSGAWLNLGIPINLYQEKIVGGVTMASPGKLVESKSADPKRERPSEPKASSSVPSTQQTSDPAIASQISPPEPRSLKIALLTPQANVIPAAPLSDPQIKKYCDPNNPSNCRTVVSISGGPGLNESANGQLATHLATGNRAYNANQFDKAIASYSQVIELVPTNEVALHNRGLAYYAANQPRLALSDLKNALKFFSAGQNQAKVRQLSLAIRQIEEEILLAY